MLGFTLVNKVKTLIVDLKFVFFRVLKHFVVYINVVILMVDCTPKQATCVFYPRVWVGR
jgi:hypothetical protein